MLKDIDFVKELGEFKEALFLHDDAYRFIMHHKIWRGFANYGWASKVLVLIGILVSLTFVGIIVDWIEHIWSEGGNVLANTSTMLMDMKQLVFLEGGIKYLILIAFEIVIFHCSVTTLNILSGENKTPTFQDFKGAITRMIEVGLRSFILETIIAAIIGIILSILGLKFFSFMPIFFVHSYFIGFAFFDNYNEQYGYSVKESEKLVQKRIGGVIGIGMIATLLFKIPVIGAITAPILAATCATMYLYSEGEHWPHLPRLLHDDKLKLKPVKEKSKLKA